MSVVESIIEGELLPPEHALDVYRPFYTELAKLKQNTLTLAFDYASKDGLKDAKSYVFALRKSRKPMKDAHDRAKVDHLEFIRRVDGQYNELDAKLDEIIEIVDGPIKAAEAREAERVAGHRQVIDYIASLEVTPGMSSDDVATLCGRLAAAVVDESLEEFRDEAAVLYAQQSTALQAAHAAAVKREAEEAELAALRAEKAARDQRDHEARIAQEAADRARSEAEAAAERGRIMQEISARAEREASEAREKAERARAERAEAETAAAIESAARAQREAEERAAKAIRDTEERLRLEAEQRSVALKLEEDRRAADVEHNRVVNNEILADLIQFAGVSEQTGKMVVVALFSGKVRNIRITY